MRRCLWIGLLFLLPAPSPGNELVTDLSTSEVSIQTNFDGETVLLFGAFEPSRKNASPDIVVILNGPGEVLTIRRKDRNFGLWINSDAVSVTSAPSYYAVAASRDLASIAPDKTRRDMGIGLDYVAAELDPDRRDKQLFLEGLIRNKQSRQLYSENPKGVKIIGNRLFRTEITLPPGVPTGAYEAKIMLFEDGEILSMKKNRINVGIGGFENSLHNLAHQLPILYGLTGVAIAVLFGWAAAVLFRRRA